MPTIIKSAASFLAISLATFLPGAYLIHTLYTPDSIKDTRWIGASEMYINNSAVQDTLTNITTSDFVIKIQTEVSFLSDNSFNATVDYKVRDTSTAAPLFDINFMASGSWEEFGDTIKFRLIDLKALEPNLPSDEYLYRKKLLRRFLTQQLTDKNYTIYKLDSNKIFLENINHQTYILNKL